MVKISNIEKLQYRTKGELQHRLYRLEREIRNIKHINIDKSYVISNEIEKTKYVLRGKK